MAESNDSNVCLKCGTSDRNKRGNCKVCAKASAARWYANNPEKQIAASRKWQAKNYDRCLQYSRKWAIEHPEQVRLREHTKRAKRANAFGKLTPGLSKKLFVLQKGKCPCCRLPLGDDYHLDHKMPIALGGPNTDDNMQLLRKSCNLKKSAKHPVDFMQSRGFLL